MTRRRRCDFVAPRREARNFLIGFGSIIQTESRQSAYASSSSPPSSSSSSSSSSAAQQQPFSTHYSSDASSAAAASSSSTDAAPCRISADFGYVREWNFQAPTAQICALGLRKVEPGNRGSTINGVIFPAPGVSASVPLS